MFQLGAFGSKSPLAQVIVEYRTGDKPSPEPILVLVCQNVGIHIYPYVPSLSCIKSTEGPTLGSSIS